MTTTTYVPTDAGNMVGETAELAERLRAGPVRTGDTEDGEYELFDIEEAQQIMLEAADAITSMAQRVAAMTAERDEARETNRKLNRLNQEYEHAFADGLRALDEKAVGGQHFTDYAKLFLQTHRWYGEALKRAEAAEAQLAQAREAAIEECAKVADAQVGHKSYGYSRHTANLIVDAIRALAADPNHADTPKKEPK